MTYPVGHIPASALQLVQTGIYLLKPQARALARLQAAAKKLGHTVTVARPAGGVRTEAVQNAMHHAGSAAGSRAEKERWGLSTVSTVAIATHPNGTHEHGDRVDLLVDRRICTQVWFIALAAKYGFTREFGASDPNHYRHDGKTATTLVVLPKPKPKTVTVHSGDTLGEIAARQKLTLPAVLALNPKIHDPDLIYVGQKITVRR